MSAEACGLPIVGMPEGVTPLSALVVLKALDDEGDVTYYARATEGVSVVEALGMASLAELRLRDALSDGDDS